MPEPTLVVERRRAAARLLEAIGDQLAHGDTLDGPALYATLRHGADDEARDGQARADYALAAVLVEKLAQP